MNSKAYNHLFDFLRFPETANVNQAAYDRARLQDVEKAKQSRPHFLPVRHDLPAAISTLPIRSATEELNYDVIVTGAITDGEDRRANFYRRRNEEAFIDVGDESDVHLSLDALAGKSVATGGLAGVQRFLSPFILREKITISLEIFQETAIADVVWTTFTALRVFTPNHREAQLTALERSQVLDAIGRYSVPQPRYLVMPVEFDANGVASPKSPKHEEPLLIYGFRSTFSDALVNFGLTSTDSFSNSLFPIEALCAEPNNGRKLFEYLLEPIFLPVGQQLYFKLENTKDDVLFATDGQIEFLCKTP